MSAKSHWLRFLIIPVLIGVIGVTVTAAKDDHRRYFSETGHWVIGRFLTAYESVAEPALLFGLPITNEFYSDTADGRLVQYFEHVRFEFRPENPPELQVVMSPLGKFLYEQEQPSPEIPLPQGDAGCRSFSETGFQVCYAFLNFYDAYGGIDQFGYPVSNLEEHDSYAVQYFQFARLEWHPELSAGQQVCLTDIGRRYFTLFEDPRRAQPITNGAPHVIIELQVQAYVSQPVMLPSGEQTVYVVVQDQSLAPVEGALVSISLRIPSDSPGNEIAIPAGATDGKGIATVTFPLRNQENGLVEIVVTASLNDMQEQTITSYRVWW